MKRLNILVLVLMLASGFSSAQTFLGLSDLSIPSKIAPAYFGPNAFPVPQMSDGTTSARWKAELYSEHFFGTMSDWRDDYTTSIFARLTIPLFSPRVNLVIGGPVYEFFHSGPSANAFRRLPYAGDINYHTPGDIYVSTDFQTLVQSRHGIDMTVRAALKSASGSHYEYARYYDSPGYFFDASFIPFIKEVFIVIAYHCTQEFSSDRRHEYPQIKTVKEFNALFCIDQATTAILDRVKHGIHV